MCGEVLPLSSFGVVRRGSDRRRSGCKRCLAARARAWQAANPERTAEMMGARHERYRLANAGGVVRVSEKRCSSCGVTKPADAFSRETRSASGLNSACRECLFARRPKAPPRPRRLCSECGNLPAMPEAKRCESCRSRAAAELARRRGLLADGWKECSRCGEVKPVRMFTRGKAGLGGFDNRCKACLADYRREHPERFSEWAHRRRARLGGSDWREVDRLSVFIREGGRCHICHRKVDPDNFHLEHLWPLAAGGEHSPSNVAIAHPSCNLQKGARLEVVQLRLG